MDSEEELDIILTAVVLIKKMKRKGKEEIYKSRSEFDIDRLVNEMRFTSISSYFK